MPEPETITLTVRRAAAVALLDAWEAGASDNEIVRRTADLLDGADGALDVLDKALTLPLDPIGLPVEIMTFGGTRHTLVSWAEGWTCSCGDGTMGFRQEDEND